MFEFVTKKEVNLRKSEIEVIIHKVQDFLRENNILTFQYHLVGSASNQRHLVTRVINGNQGFDMDYNIIIQWVNPNHNTPEKIKKNLMQTFNKFLKGNFKYCEDSTSVFTIKKVDKQNSKIIYSYDFAIVHNFEENCKNPDYDDEYDDPKYEYFTIERQEYIYFDKSTKKYSWEVRPDAFNDHKYKEQYIKQAELWNILRETYLQQKNLQPHKKSRIIYYETLNQIFQKHFY
ncbi:MAG: hypothetical protein J6C53_00055 [Clostridia bacterium]|nr:hypothetical protein [Clostridia bacterium]